MSDAKGVIGAFGTLGETREPLYLPHAVHAVASSGENFVWVGLMPYIPDDAVVGGVEDMVQRHREFDHAKPRAEVPAGAGH